MNSPLLKLKFTIGEVSKILDIPMDTLRYYDKINLLPSNDRDGNGYRYYDLEQFDSLITIRMLRAMDVPIERIQNLLTSDSLDEIRELIEGKKRDVIRQLTFLKQLSQKLDAMDEQFRRFEDTDTIELVKSNPFWVLLTDSVMESGDKKLGSRVQQQVRSMNVHQEWLAFCHIISVVSKENLESGQYHSYLHNGILSTFPMEENTGIFQRLTPCYCARKCVVIGREGYAELDEHYDQMKAFIRRRGLQIDGNSLEVNLYNQYNKHYIEMYIPVAEAGNIKGGDQI
ncbi:GntR family transcriptional regulator [Paenibacillus sp. J23TS9]|uniref:MerR family DNA-binding transcriptional regulator n=1 Tax=Paenibacillus sp. J23TS9 TaxID=2807193 RepID=UPI001AFDFB07|nr:MerR family transcriptional regulator [Paenibacillus sp. J23TS9]GIP28554.1 GntR family transcriptional regulator [Paenibacillus sp. J23TS9]